MLSNDILYKNIKTSLLRAVEVKCNDIANRWAKEKLVNE